MAGHGRMSTAAVVAAMLVTACSATTGGDGSGSLATVGTSTVASTAPAGGPDGAVTTTTPSVTLPGDSTLPAATTLPPASTTSPPTTAPNPCAAAPTLPGEALDFSELRADLTGDGAPDLLIAYGMPTADGLMRRRLRLEPSGGPASDLELDDAAGPGVTILGAVQLGPPSAAADPIGRAGRAEEVLVALGSAVDGVGVGVVGADDTGCLFRFGDGLGAAARFTVGATDRLHQGLRCESSGPDQVLVQLVATRAEAQTFATRDIRLQRVTTNLVPESVAEGTASLDGPSLFAYSLVDCPGITAL